MAINTAAGVHFMIETPSPGSIPAPDSPDFSGTAASEVRQREVSPESIMKFREALSEKQNAGMPASESGTAGNIPAEDGTFYQAASEQKAGSPDPAALSGKAGEDMDKFSDSKVSGSWDAPGERSTSGTQERSSFRGPDPDFRNSARDLLQSRLNPEGSQKTISDSTSGESPRRQISELSDIFSSVFSGRSDIAPPAGLRNEAPGTAPAPETAPAPSSGEELMKIADSLVEKILVSDPRSTAGSQVMITMNDRSQLSGTEIVLTRSNDGTLAVVINSANDSQYRKISEAREKLELALKKLERGSFTVTVNPPDRENA